MKDVIAADGELVVRPVREEAGDYERIVAWRNSPHVREWWDPDDAPLTLAALRDELDEQIRGDDTTTSCIIEQSREPVGVIQFYPWDAEEQYLAEIGVTVPPGSWGLDIFIGKPGLEGTGVGAAAVRVLSDYLFDDRDATVVALITEASNARAQASYRKAGMRVVGDPFRDLDTRGGQRVESVLMIRDRPGGTVGAHPITATPTNSSSAFGSTRPVTPSTAMAG
jgi:RimJ/RimL family protein N-acetyltransferase